MKRYLLCPGYVHSSTDGQEHFIAAGQLAQLYGVPITQCYVLPSGFGSASALARRRELLRRDDLMQLVPRADGDYSLPKPKRLNGCHNRAPYKETVSLPGGVSFPFRMAPDCQYTLTALGQADAGCTGCRWRQEGAPC